MADTLISSAVALAWTFMEGERGLRSLALEEAFDQDQGEDATGLTYKEYWETVFAPEEMQAVRSHLLKALETEKSITIWRSVKIVGSPTEAIAEYAKAHGIGRYWSFERDHAHPHEGTGTGLTYLMEAMVADDQIDWVETLAASAVPDWMGESEIRLKADAQVAIKKLVRRDGQLERLNEVNTQDIDLGELKDVYFFSGQGVQEQAPTFGM